MPFNSSKKYDALLEIDHLSPLECSRSLRKVFDRDFKENQNVFKTKIVHPIKDDAPALDTLFKHLTHKEDRETNKRDIFDPDRSKRLHWVRPHLEEEVKQNMLLFSIIESGELKTYLFNKDKRYLIVLVVFREGKIGYYLLSAHYLRDKKDEERHDLELNKIMNKYSRRLPDLY